MPPESANALPLNLAAGRWVRKDDLGHKNAFYDPSISLSDVSV
jgi:hypothetical protein